MHIAIDAAVTASVTTVHSSHRVKSGPNLGHHVTGCLPSGVAATAAAAAVAGVSLSVGRRRECLGILLSHKQTFLVLPAPQTQHVVTSCITGHLRRLAEAAAAADGAAAAAAATAASIPATRMPAQPRMPARTALLAAAAAAGEPQAAEEAAGAAASAAEATAAEAAPAVVTESAAAAGPAAEAQEVVAAGRSLRRRWWGDGWRCTGCWTTTTSPAKSSPSIPQRWTTYPQHVPVGLVCENLHWQ